MLRFFSLSFHEAELRSDNEPSVGLLSQFGQPTRMGSGSRIVQVGFQLKQLQEFGVCFRAEIADSWALPVKGSRLDFGNEFRFGFYSGIGDAVRGAHGQAEFRFPRCKLTSSHSAHGDLSGPFGADSTKPDCNLSVSQSGISQFISCEGSYFGVFVCHVSRRDSRPCQTHV